MPKPERFPPYNAETVRQVRAAKVAGEAFEEWTIRGNWPNGNIEAARALSQLDADLYAGLFRERGAAVTMTRRTSATWTVPAMPKETT